jgi:undecaprenyl-diphosphatase
MLEFQIFVSQIAGVKVMFFAVLLLLVALYIFQCKKDFYKIIFVSTSAMFVTYTLKYILQVPRLETILVPENDFRFPSGHATMAAVVMSLIIYYSHKKVRNLYLRYFLYALGVSWFVLASYSRIYLHAHILIDVVVGGLIGVLATVVVMRVFRHLRYYR